MTVRENCYYALWQARLYEPEKYVWIYSLCINQSDLHEKRLQVQMMGLLYRQANLRSSSVLDPIQTVAST